MLELIKLKEENLEMVRTWRNSPEVSQYMYTNRLISETDQKKWFERMSNDMYSKYWVINHNDVNIGLASITNIDPTLSSCYWAFYLGNTSIRGAGIGSKIEYKIIEYVFNDLRLNKLRCEVFVANDKVIKMHEKFGFRREAFYREHCIKDNKKLDVVGLGLLKSDWARLKEGFQNQFDKPEA